MMKKYYRWPKKYIDEEAEFCAKELTAFYSKKGEDLNLNLAVLSKRQEFARHYIGELVDDIKGLKAYIKLLET